MNKDQLSYLIEHPEKVIPDCDSLDIFRHKCVVCRKPTESLHEINPRSLNKKALVWINRVPLCLTCHWIMHYDGAANHIEELQDIRDQRLQDYWGICLVST